jgi:hypothetical protein
VPLKLIRDPPLIISPRAFDDAPTEQKAGVPDVHSVQRPQLGKKTLVM